MLIKTIPAEEIDQLEQTAYRLWHQSYDDLLPAGQVDYMLHKFQSAPAMLNQQDEGYIYRGVYDGEELVGYTASLPQEERIFLSKLYLDKAYQGSGWGRKMIEDVFDLYEDMDTMYLTVNKYNPTFVIYRHLGFEVIDSVVTDIGQGFVMDDYVMQKVLVR